jgi:hypothetical protein
MACLCGAPSPLANLGYPGASNTIIAAVVDRDFKNGAHYKPPLSIRDRVK